MTFSRPVLNPVIHFGGLGGTPGPGNRSTTFHGTLTLTTRGSADEGRHRDQPVTGGSKITAVDDRTSTSCTDGRHPGHRRSPACGSARINGLVTSATFAWAPSRVTSPAASDLTGAGDEFFVLATIDTDFGDGPSAYETTNAARHVVGGLKLGSAITADATATLNPTTSPNAGAGATGDSDDGVTPGTVSRSRPPTRRRSR